MSDTPRTDAAVQVYYDTGQSFAVVEPELSRQLERELNNAQDLARELRDALERVINLGHAENCLFLNCADWLCDCGVDDASALINKAKEVLG